MNLTSYSDSDSSESVENNDDPFNLKCSEPEFYKNKKPHDHDANTTTGIVSGGKSSKLSPSLDSFNNKNNVDCIKPAETWSFGLDDGPVYHDITMAPVCANQSANRNKANRFRSGGDDGGYPSEADILVNKYISSKRRKTSNDQYALTSEEHASNFSDVDFLVNSTIRSNLKKAPNDRIPMRPQLSLMDHDKPVNKIQWCCEVFSHLLLSASMDSYVKITDIFKEKCVHTIRSHTAGVKDACWSCCGKKISSCGFDKMLISTDVETGKATSSYTHDEYLSSVQFHPTNDNLLVLGSNNILLSFDMRQCSDPIRTFKYKDKMGQVLDICFLTDNEFACSCDFVCQESADRCLMVWDLATASVVSNQIFHEKYTCPKLCRHPFRNEFIAQTNGNYIAQFKSEPPFRMCKHKQFNKHKVSGYSVGCDINKNGRLVMSGSADGRVMFYDYFSTKLLSSLTPAKNDGDVVLDVAWHPVLNGTCAHSTWNGCVHVWN